MSNFKNFFPPTSNGAKVGGTPHPSYPKKRECPVCFFTLISQVFQCHNGHLICEPCLSQLTHCPVCWDKFPLKKIRALEFEAVMQELMTPCRFKTFGCKQEFHPDDGADHESGCEFMTIDCPLPDDPCGDKSISKTLWKEHLDQIHRVTGIGHYKLGEWIEIRQRCGVSIEEMRKGAKINSHFIEVDETLWLFFRTRIGSDKRFIHWALTSQCSSQAKKGKDGSNDLRAVIRLVPMFDTKAVMTHMEWSGPILPSSQLTFSTADRLDLYPSVPVDLLKLFGDCKPNGPVTWKLLVKVEGNEINRAHVPHSRALQSHVDCTKISHTVLDQKYTQAIAKPEIYEPSSPTSSRGSDEDGQVPCAHCTFLNEKNRLMCECCGQKVTGRPVPEDSSP